MKKQLLVLITLSFVPLSWSTALDPVALKTADYAVSTYEQTLIDELRQLVAFPTYHQAGTENKNNRHFIAMKAFLGKRARALGFSYEDFGEVVVIAFGEGKEKIGVITHGDVQPADAKRWQKSPYELDTQSEPGKLIGRGTEDDKSAVVTALLAMKSIKDKAIKLNKRIELIISMTEESNWQPFQEFVDSYPIPKTNIVIDSSYPAVIAEKGWGMITVTIPKMANRSVSEKAYLVSEFSGGYFASQVPELALATVHFNHYKPVQADPYNTSSALLQLLESSQANYQGMRYVTDDHGDKMTIKATGQSSHSAAPENGVNALTHSAVMLNALPLVTNEYRLAIQFIAELIGLGVKGEQFGDIAFSDPFMGPLTLSLSTVKTLANGDLELAINLRIPRGKALNILKAQIEETIDTWSEKHRVSGLKRKITLGEAYVLDKASHAQVLIAIFKHYTGQKDAKAISIAGSTHAKLLPNAVGFGPSMPDVPYTGHSEHEYITRDQLRLNLKMYTAMLIQLATSQ